MSLPGVSVKDSKPYDFRLVPAINEINSHLGSPQGQIIEISGTGFSTIPSENKVTYGNSTCNVISCSEKLIRCKLEPLNKINGTHFVGGSGIKTYKFIGSKVHGAKSLFNTIAKYSLNNSRIPTIEKEFVLLEHEDQILNMFVFLFFYN